MPNTCKLLPVPKFRQIQSHCSQPSSDFRYTNCLSKIQKLPQRKTFFDQEQKSYWAEILTKLVHIKRPPSSPLFILSVVIDFLERPSLVCTRFSICQNWYKRLEKCHLVVLYSFMKNGQSHFYFSVSLLPILSGSWNSPSFHVGLESVWPVANLINTLQS